jgi:mycothiol synthase
MAPDTPQLRVDVTRQLDSADLSRVTAIIADATRADGTAPLSEDARLRVRSDGEEGVWSLIGRLDDGGERLLVGYGQLAREPAADTERPGLVGEIVVDPAWRGHGYGRTLLGTMVVTAESVAPRAPLKLWAHGSLPGATRLAESCGFAPVRELWFMARRLDAGEPPQVEPPAGVVLRPYRPDADDEAWLALNARAFADHPEQGSWTRDELLARRDEPWFDPEGFIVAERAGSLVGFHWTKIDPTAARPGVSVGEIYVLGVDPAEQGSGLGRALANAGLRYLGDRGVDEVVLYVDGDNAGAIRLYRRLGFQRRSLDVMYRRL